MIKKEKIPNWPNKQLPKMISPQKAKTNKTNYKKGLSSLESFI